MNIKTVSTSKLRNNLADVLGTIDKRHPFCIITRRGRQEHAIINLDKLEDLLAANDPKYLKEIAEARRQVADGEIFSFEDVFGNV